MSVNAEKAMHLEADFLAGVESNLHAAEGGLLRGSIWQTARLDDEDRLRALLAENRTYDRERLKTLPANRRVALYGFEKRFIFGRRRTGVAIASTMSPLSALVGKPEEAGPAIGLGELHDHVHKLVGEANMPHVIGVCSTTGFTPQARDAKFSIPKVSVVLVEPDGQGGWRVHAAGDAVDDRLVKLFDPEKESDKVDRAREMIESYSAELVTGSLSASTVAKEVNLPEHLVRKSFRQLADSDAELKIVDRDGQLLMYRGAAGSGSEKKSMNMIDKIKQLFSGEGDEAEKINLLAERRATLTQRRDRFYEDIAKLEKKEAGLLEEGKQARSAVPRRRIAAQMAQLRKDIARQNTTGAMLNQQINIISTDIHNLTLIQQGDLAQLPDTEELTTHAVEAEEMLESLRADSEMVGSLEAGIEQTLMSDEEQAILKEFESHDAGAETVETPPSVVSPPEKSPRVANDSLPTSARPETDEPESPDSRKADPEPS